MDYSGFPAKNGGHLRLGGMERNTDSSLCPEMRRLDAFCQSAPTQALVLEL